MKPVIQEETSGCGIASSAAIAGISYSEAKAVANAIGIYAEDQSLWSDPQHIRRILAELGIETGKEEKPFQIWGTLPDCALLSIKWHLENGKPYWHWVVFVREEGKPYVLDSKKALRNNIRTDFGRMKPKWFIDVYIL
jgi:ABC-type bacteriocin/lantibiotic exporter with double-glycine peptidase domain